MFQTRTHMISRSLNNQVFRTRCSSVRILQSKWGILKDRSNPSVIIPRRYVPSSSSHWSLAHAGQAMTSLYISSCGQSSRGTREEEEGLKTTWLDKRSVLGGFLLCMICRPAHRSGIWGGWVRIDGGERGDWALLRALWLARIRSRPGLCFVWIQTLFIRDFAFSWYFLNVCLCCLRDLGGWLCYVLAVFGAVVRSIAGPGSVESPMMTLWVIQ